MFSMTLREHGGALKWAWPRNAGVMLRNNHRRKVTTVVTEGKTWQMLPDFVCINRISTRISKV